MNQEMFILMAAIISAYFAAVIVIKRQQTGDNRLAFESNAALFTPAEKIFLGVIESVLEHSNYRVFGKVHLGDIVKPRKGIGKDLYASALNKIDRKHVHFVICRRDDLTVIAAIEFEEKSHGTVDRQENFKGADDVLYCAKIPCLHITAQNGYALSDIREKLSFIGIDIGRCVSVTEQLRSRPWSRLVPATRPHLN